MVLHSEIEAYADVTKCNIKILLWRLYVFAYGTKFQMVHLSFRIGGAVCFLEGELHVFRCAFLLPFCFR